MSFTWGSGPKIPVNVSDNISRDNGTAYSGYVTVSLGAVTGGSTFGYYIDVTVGGTTKRLKENTPSQWSSGAYSASFYVSGSTTASSISISITMGTNAPRGSSTYTYTTSIGSYDSGDSGGSSPGGGTTTTVSQPTLSKSSAKLGETVTIYTNRKSSRYTHTISYKVGSVTGTIATGVTTSTAWAIPIAGLINAVSAVGTACVITVDTYLSRTKVGSASARLTLYPSEDILPTVSSGWVSVSRDNGLIPDVSAWVKGYSKARIAFDTGKVSTKYGATIRSFSILYNGVRTEAANGAATTGVLADVDATVYCTVTDSRGNTVTEAVEIPVLDYAPPTITNVSVYRCDDALLAADAGTHIAALATAGCAPLGGANSVTLSAAYKPADDDSYGTEVTLQSGAAGMITGSAEVDTMQSYMVRLTATDKLGNSTVFEKAVPTKAVTFHLKNGGKGAAFGKYAEKDNYLDCQWNAAFGQSVEIAEGLTIGNKTLAEVIEAVVTPLLPNALTIDAVYPVGSVYITVSDEEPETLFPGTYWERLSGRFLLGASTDLYVNGVTGGEAQVTLTTTEMPSHTHTGTAEGDGAHSHSFPGRSSNGSSGPSAESFASSDDARTLYTDSDGYHTHAVSVSAAGGGAAHNNMPPYLVVNMWKRTK